MHCLPYLTKRELIKQIGTKVVIPTNDVEAYKLPQNARYLYLYDKLIIAQTQGLKCGTDIPREYPVFAKPRINLYGMSRGATKIDNESQYRAHQSKVSDELFWTEYLTGDHLSIDLFLKEGKILRVFCFKGYVAEKGMFDYWRFIPDYPLPDRITGWFRKHLRGYTGCVNIETIGENMIECHLRYGDINFFDLYFLRRNGDCPITKSIINLYQDKDPVTIPKLPNLYQFAVFVPKRNYIHSRVTFDDAHEICNKHGVVALQKDKDPKLVANRIFSLITDRYTNGRIVKDKLLQLYADF
jgi:hypothetical protein